MTEKEEMIRGEEADRILNSNVFQESMTKVRDGIIATMSQSALGDSETHNRLVIAMQLLNQIEKQLKDVMNTGKMARIQVNDGFAAKVKSFVR